MKSLNLLTKRVSLASFLILQIILGGNLSAEGIEYKPAGTPKRIVITDKGDKIAVIEGDRTISVYSTKSNKKISRFRNTSDIDDLTFSPNGYHLMTGDEDNTRKIWNVNSGKLLSTLKGQRGDVNAVDYSPNGKLAAASSDDSSIRIWDPIASKVIRTLKTKERPKDIRFFGNNRDIIISTYNGFQIRNAHTAKLLATFGSKPGYKRFTVNRAGTIVLGIPEGRMDEYVEAWDIKSKKKLFTLKGHKYQVDKVIFSKDEKSFVTVSHDDKIKVWNAEDGTEIHSIENKNGSLHVLALDGNPSRIWVGDSKSVKLIDLPGIDAKMRANFASQAKSAKTSELAFSVYQTYKNKLIFPGDKSALNDLLKYAYKIERDAAVASDSSKSMYAIYSKYNKEFVTKEDRADHLELYHAAMKSHFNGTLATKSVEKMVGIYKTYAGMNHTGKTNELVKGFLKDAIDWSLSQPDLTQDTKLTVFNHWVEVIVLNHSESRNI